MEVIDVPAVAYRSNVKTTNRKDRITRRGFLELGSAALATAGLLGDSKAATAALETANPDSAPMTGKIALEEHFVLPENRRYQLRRKRSPNA